MPANPIDQNDLTKELVNRIKALEKQVEALTTAKKTRFNVPLLTADPSDLIDGEIWYRTDTDELKTRKNGTTRTITTS